MWKIVSSAHRPQAIFMLMVMQNKVIEIASKVVWMIWEWTCSLVWTLKYSCTNLWNERAEHWLQIDIKMCVHLSNTCIFLRASGKNSPTAYDVNLFKYVRNCYYITFTE